MSLAQLVAARERESSLQGNGGGGTSRLRRPQRLPHVGVMAATPAGCRLHHRRDSASWAQLELCRMRPKFKLHFSSCMVQVAA